MAYIPPISNPPIPYSAPIPGGRLTDGTIVTIQGEPINHDGFSINFSASGSLNSLGTTGLHFNPRFKENTVVRNSLQNGAWGAEERSGGMPFHENQVCEIIFLVKSNAFKIAVNGKHFCEFNHRIPKEQLQYLLIAQGIRVNFIKFENENMPAAAPPPAGGYPGAGFPAGYPGAGAPAGYPGAGAPAGYPGAGAPAGYPGAGAPAGYPGAGAPAGYPGAGAPAGYPGAGGYPPSGGYPGAGGAAPGQPVYNPPVPFSMVIPGGLSPGKMIFISGIPNANPTRFSTYLCVGNSYGGDVALTFDTRFNFGSERNVTVRNHRVGGNWGPEEKHGSYFPFQPNANFDMIILVEPNAYKIAVNNQHFVEFNHRIPQLQSVGCLYIEGDVRLTQVKIQ